MIKIEGAITLGRPRSLTLLPGGPSVLQRGFRMHCDGMIYLWFIQIIEFAERGLKYRVIESCFFTGQAHMAPGDPLGTLQLAIVPFECA